jgi:gamma-glutamylcyclotransferase
MHYFAYGSNMSIVRLRERVPSAVSLGCYILTEYDLRFHKSSKDGSGKCDAYFTENSKHVILGVLFEIDFQHKSALDKAEGLGYGYDQKEVEVVSSNGSTLSAITYVATKIDKHLKPYSWYVNHVLVGAREASLSDDYIQRKINSVEAVEDRDTERDAKQRSLHN